MPSPSSRPQRPAPATDTTATAAAARIRAVGAVAIIRGSFATATVVSAARVLVEAGLSVMEVTLNSPGALDTIAALRGELGEAALVGAGTCRTEGEVRSALDGGAQFTVAPNLDRDSVRLAVERDRLHLPGVFTGTEIGNALAYGATMVKLFPCDSAGPKLVRALLAPYDELELVAVGGVAAGNAAEFIAAGAVAVGLGSSLTKRFDDLPALRAEAAALRQALDGALAGTLDDARTA